MAVANGSVYKPEKFRDALVLVVALTIAFSAIVTAWYNNQLSKAKKENAEGLRQLREHVDAKFSETDSRLIERKTFSESKWEEINGRLNRLEDATFPSKR